MRLLVIGSSGQLARALLEQAGKRPAIDFIAVGRPELDLEQAGNAAHVIAAIAPHAVINAAGFTAVDRAEAEVDRAFRVNADAAGEIALAAAEVGAPIVQISTDYVFDGRSDEPYDEDATTNPINVYGRSKLAGEEAVRSANPRHIILRTAWLYSQFGQNFVKSIIAAAKERDELSVVDDQFGNPTSALDLAEAILNVIDALKTDRGGLGQTYHFAGTGSTSWFGFAKAIMTECRNRGLPVAEVNPIHSEDWPSAAPRPRNSRLNSCKFATRFGYSCPEWAKSLSCVLDRLSGSV